MKNLHFPVVTTIPTMPWLPPWRLVKVGRNGDPRMGRGFPFSSMSFTWITSLGTPWESHWEWKILFFLWKISFFLGNMGRYGGTSG
jgi:hypothetical protein